MSESKIISWTLSVGDKNYNLLDEHLSDISISELSTCKFVLKLLGVQPVSLMIGDFEVKVKPVANVDDVVTYSTEWIDCFKNFIGLTHAELYLKNDGHLFTSIAMNIYARKITYDRALSLLRMIGEKSDISSICFSVTKLNSDKNNSATNITAMLNAGISALDYFQQNRSRFAQFPCSRTKTVIKTKRYSDSVHLDDRSIAYICNHPDSLQTSQFYEMDVALGNRYFKINQIETNSYIKDTDIIENQVIVAFIYNFADYLRGLLGRIARYKESGRELLEIDGENYVSIDRLLVDSGLILSLHVDKISSALDKCLQCLNFIQKSIPCNLVNGANVLPLPTQQVLARTHYLQLFSLIKNYYDVGDPQWRGQMEFFGLRNLYKIYEFVCLIYIIDSIQSIGFIVKDANYLNKDYIPADIRPINEPSNYYVFEKGEMKIELYYEPKAVNAKNIAISNSKACLVDLVHKNSMTWTPDYVIKVSTGEFTTCHVLDAKYSDKNTVEKIHLPECAFKYTTKMAHLNRSKQASPISSLTLLYSDIKAGYDSFHVDPFGLYSYNGELNSNVFFPITGKMPLHEGNADEFKKVIKDLISSKFDGEVLSLILND